MSCSSCEEYGGCVYYMIPKDGVVHVTAHNAEMSNALREKYTAKCAHYSVICYDNFGEIVWSI